MESLEEFPRRSQSFSLFLPSPKVRPTPSRTFLSNENDQASVKIDRSVPSQHSLSINSLPPTAVIRDSIVSKRQVSILEPPIQSPQQPTIETQTDSDTTSIYSARSLKFEISPSSEINLSSSGIAVANDPSNSAKGTRTLVCSNPRRMTEYDDNKSHMSDLRQLKEPNSSCDSDLGLSYLSARSSNSSSSSLSTMERLPTKGNIKAPEISLMNFEHFAESGSTNEGLNSRPTSQGSISDFYDTYFRQSIFRQSTLDNTMGAELKRRNEYPINFGKAKLVDPSHTGKRVLAPKGLAKEIIVELNHPKAKPDGFNGERYPKLISPLG